MLKNTSLKSAKNMDHGKLQYAKCFSTMFFFFLGGGHLHFVAPPVERIRNQFFDLILKLCVIMQRYNTIRYDTLSVDLRGRGDTMRYDS